MQFSTETEYDGAIVSAYPLCWPTGWDRHKGRREYGQFKGNMSQARGFLIDEVSRLVLGARARSYVYTDLVISTNTELRGDGLPYSNRRKPEDPGAAVYFERDGKRICMACDKYDEIWKNLKAIGKTVEAMRGIERWGSSELLDRAFTGFLGLPEKSASETCWSLMGFEGSTKDLDAIKRARNRMSALAHPDRGGSTAAQAAINEAYAQAVNIAKQL